MHYCSRIIKKALFPQHVLDCQNENSSKLTCDICGQKLSSFYSLRSHKKVVHQGLQRCLICYQYFEAAIFPQHWLTCQNQKDALMVACLDCGKKFSAPGTLKQHHQKEHEGTIFKCNECGKFLPMSELTVHGSTCFCRSDKLAAGVCIWTWNCKEKVDLPGKIYCQYHRGKFSLLCVLSKD